MYTGAGQSPHVVSHSETIHGGRPVKTIYLGLGSNLGDKKKNIKEAIKLLKKSVKVTKISSFYKTKPVGYLEQPDFINAAVKIKTTFSPNKLLTLVKKIEKKLGRKKTFRWGPRVIDIDILIYEDKIIKTKKLTIPHPQMHQRYFVLKPLAELNPEFGTPRIKKKMKNLLFDLKE